MIQFDHFYTCQEIDAAARALADAHPAICRAGSIGRTGQGRDIHLLTLTDFDTGAPFERPAYLVHGGIHAHEPASAHGPLYTAHRLLADHERGGLLSRVVIYLIPRLCPDASEFCIATTARIRSRTDFLDRAPNTIYAADIDGDGAILTIRQEHPDGTWVCDPAEPRLLVDRRPTSRGPFYRVFPEGLINDWDGSDDIRIGGLHAFYPGSPELHAGRSFDFNRNWSHDWRHEGEQQGAGDYPFSEPEMRSLADFIFKQPKLCGILGYHCGSASIIRPPAWGPREDLDADDDALLEEIAQEGAAAIDSPAVAISDPTGSDRRRAGKRGHALGFAYYQLGIPGFEVELGTIVNAAGVSPREWHERSGDPDEVDAMYRQLLRWWDAGGRRHRVFEPWRRFDHPQLGPVELGGLLYTAIDNPLVPALEPMVAGAYRFTRSFVERHPRVQAESVEVTGVGGDAYRIRARIANRGRLPTNVTNLGRGLPRMQPVRASLTPADGVELLSARGHLELGHLRALTGSRVVEWFVRAAVPAGTELAVIRVLGGAGGDSRVQVRRP